MYNYRQHFISEETAKALEEAEDYINEALDLANEATSNRDFMDAQFYYEKAYEKWDEVFR